ncbi:hypothetical protein CBS101457_006109 [Exobasidium rhododendri]|nr:hypothetical protein CBS101457_006109 [Exobasidium rhododendri]
MLGGILKPSSGDGGIETALHRRRSELAGHSGIAGLLENPRTVAIAVFASMGGLIYGYNQGMFGQVLSMHSFGVASGAVGISNPTLAGLLTSILELGAWVGVLINGYSADKLGRKMSVVVACIVFVIGVIVQTCTKDGKYSTILGGRFVTGLGVGSLSMVVPLYNAELSPPEIRGSLVSLQQLAITFGIMISYWITYGTNFIGGTGDGQSRASWLVPITIQILPAIILGVGIMFLPQSPRWLMDQGREEECLQVIASLRRQGVDAPIVRFEFLEIKAQKEFETRVSIHDHPNLQDNSAKSRFLLGLAGYTSLLTNRSNFKRVAVAVLIMTFQQWTGVNFILYYAPFIFANLGLNGKTTSLLASGVVGILMFLATIPTVLYLDKWGRKPTLIAGSIVMACSHYIVAAIIGSHDNGKGLPEAPAAGWTAVVFIWIFAMGFGFSWGPGAWVIVSEIFPLGLRAKGISIGASSNWLNNFAVALSTPDFVAAAPYGAYIFLGSICVISCFYVYFLVPETKNRTLDELDELFGDQSGRSKLESAMMIQAQKDVGLLALADLDTTGLEKESTSEGARNSNEKAIYGERQVEIVPIVEQS